MTTILLSCYRCDPDGVSEAYSGYKWAEALCSRYAVVLCVPAFVKDRVESALRASVAGDYRVIGVEMHDIDGQLGSFGSAVKLGFFLYESRLLRRIRRERLLDDVDLVWHRTPMSFRNRTRLHTLGKPLVIGPVGGGLGNPQELASYFRREGGLSLLRRFDAVLLGSRWWMRPFDEARCVIATCDYVRDVLPSRLDAKTVTILDVGIDTTPQPAMRAADMFTVLFVGRMVRYKGPGLALEAFARFVKRLESGAGTRLVMVGDGPELSELLRRAKAAGLDDAVVFTGRIPKGEVLEHYRRADVFLFPSLTEASGNVYLEAMNAGLPLVVVDNGGGRHIPDETCAIQVALGDEQSIIEGLANGLTALHEDESMRRTMGSASRQRVTTEFSWQVIGSRAASVVDEVTGASQPAGEGE